MNKVAIALCLIAAVLEAITHDWLWVAADITLAILNAKIVYDNMKEKRANEEVSTDDQA